MAFKRVVWLIGTSALGFTGDYAGAAVSPEEARQLSTTLTPLGAEKAGNKEGTIPAWDGGYTKVLPDYHSGAPRPDPFANEKPMFQISAQNMDKYADKLSDGVKALLHRFPTFRVDVYPTHRTAAAPQWVYDNTLKNATGARTTHGGVDMEGAYGGIPFPIPKNGDEAIWNHLAAWKGPAVAFDTKTFIVSGGNRILTTGASIDFQFPYYDKDGSFEHYDGTFLLGKLTTTAPASRAGEAILFQDPVRYHDASRNAWQYVVGERRVRRMPDIAFDSPNPIAAGFTGMDEAYLFSGSPERYDWKLVEKKEVFVPYNTQAFHTRTTGEVLGRDHLNPDYLRWELHRVWVVEATVASGKQHMLPKRRFYLDEDSWMALLYDGWNASGQLWHTGQGIQVMVPELPAILVCPYSVYDLQKNGYIVSGMLNEGRRSYQVVPRQPVDAFSPAALAAEGVR